MAIVKTIVTSAGVRVDICDDAYIHCTPGELAERRRAVRRELDRIALKAARLSAEAEEQERRQAQWTS